jgi:putative spermidine/putrescine transport system permease protein
MVRAIVAFTVLALSVPTLVVIGASFTAGEVVAFPPQGLSLRWYWRLLEQRDFTRAFGRSLQVAAMASAIMVVCGTPAAIALARLPARLAAPLNLFLLLPFTIPVVAAGVGLMGLFGALGLLGALWPVALAIAATNIPFVLWAVGAAANAMDPDLEDAAATCGAAPWRVFVTVTLPAVAPGIVTGFLLSFVVAFNEVTVSIFLTEKATATLPVELFGAVRSLVTPDIAAVAVVYVVIAAAAIWLADRLVGLETFLSSR